MERVAKESGAVSDHVQPQVVGSYLRELETALAGVPATERRAILDGAAEELSGLDAEAAAAHIEKLGDPEFIAAEARRESKTESSRTSQSAVDAGADPRWFIVLASLLVAFGGIVIPVIGWIEGIVMVWMSSTWRGWEKWVGTVTAGLLTLFAVLIPHWLFASPRAVTTADGETSNPLLPVLYDVLWAAVVFFMVANVAVGLWLLARAMRSGKATAKRLLA